MPDIKFPKGKPVPVTVIREALALPTAPLPQRKPLNLKKPFEQTIRFLTRDTYTVLISIGTGLLVLTVLIVTTQLYV